MGAFTPAQRRTCGPCHRDPNNKGVCEKTCCRTGRIDGERECQKRMVRVPTKPSSVRELPAKPNLADRLFANMLSLTGRMLHETMHAATSAGRVHS